MATGFCPFAVNRNIPPGSNDPAITPRVAILHVDAGNADSLYDYFKNRSGGIESHFFIKANGVIEQYRSIYFQADANLDANDFAVSIETQGFGDGEWNAKQLAAIKRLLLWLNDEAGIPLRKIRHWDGSGVGYHTLFGSPSHWTPIAKSCPGPDRIEQFNEVLVPWLREQRQPGPPMLRLVTHNVWVGQRGRSLRKNQGRLAGDAGQPEIVATQEAHGLKRAPFRYARLAADTNRRDEANNCVILARNYGVRVVKSRPIYVHGPRWTGPHSDVKDNQPPRVFMSATVETEDDGQLWGVLDVHRAWTGGLRKNMAAYRAEDAAIVEWVEHYKATHPGRPIIILGDWNCTKRAKGLFSVAALARRLGGELHMHGIDGAIVINATAMSFEIDDLYGSDGHRPVVITARKEN